VTCRAGKNLQLDSIGAIALWSTIAALSLADETSHFSSALRANCYLASLRFKIHL
jgi:hypothetical protein